LKLIINHQLVMTYLARAGNAIAVQGQIAAGYMNMGRQARGMGREVSLAERQMRAFGTTIRYAFAGSVIFGVTSMVGKLNELQQQMGLIAAIAGPAGVNFGTSGLARLQDELAVKSVDARTNITDLNNSVINYLSTVQGADPKQLPEIVSQIGIAARLSQTPTEDLTKAVSTLNISAGRNNNLVTINALLREWFSLISRAPGGIAAAPQIAQQLGPLASVAQLGRMQPEQLFGVSLGALRFGATPSVALRGTQYFLQSLFRPPSIQARDAMKKVGLTPEHLQQVGGTQFMREYLALVAGMGAKPTEKGVRRFGALADVMPSTEVGVGEEFAPRMDIPGLSPQAIEFLSTTLGRIHGIRTALVLLQDPRKIDAYIKSFSDLQQGIGKDANQLQRAADDYRRATPLQEAAIALDSLRSNVARDLSGILGFVAGGVSAAAQALTGDSDLRKQLLIGGAAGGGAWLLFRRLLRGKGLPGIGGLFGKTFAGAAIASSVAGGDVGPTGSATNPFYVIVLWQVGGGGGFPGGWPGRRGPGRAPWPKGPNVPRAPDPTDTVFRRALPSVLMRTLGPAAVAAAVLSLGGDTPQRPRSKALMDFWRVNIENQRAGSDVFAPNLTRFLSLGVNDPIRKRHQDIFERAFDPDTNFRKLDREVARIMKNPAMASPVVREALRNMQQPGGMFAQTVTPGGEIILNIKITDPKGKTTKLKPVKVPPEFRNGRLPSSRGRRKTIRMEDVFPSWMLPENRGSGR
jgi:hypothetical protein